MVKCTKGVYCEALCLFLHLGIVLVINVFSVKVAARFLEFISSLKLLVLVLVIVAALYRVIRHGEFSTWPLVNSHFVLHFRFSGCVQSCICRFFNIMVRHHSWVVRSRICL